MKIILAPLFICCFLFATAQPYKKLHFDAILVDTHNDIPSTAIEKGLSFDMDLGNKTNSDLRRMKAGGVDVQLFSIWCDGNQQNPFAWANREIDTVMAWTNRNPGDMMQAFSPKEIHTAVKEKKLAVMFGVEGGHMIENDLNKLVALHNRGVKYMTLTWNNSTDWATSALDETTKGDSLKHKGLTDFGKQVVKKMNELGMLVDLSHTGEQIKAIGKNGGVIHINFYSGFIDSAFDKRSEAFTQKHKAERDSLLKLNPEPYYMEVYLFEKYPDEVKALRPPLSAVIDHLDYIVKMIGVDHVGLGSDFDGVNSLPQQLDDVTTYPLITKELVKRGYSKKDIRKILGGNFLRVLEANSK